MGFGKAVRVCKGERSRQQPSTNPRSARTVIHDEPAQVGNVCTQIFAVYGNRTDDIVALHRGPDRVARVCQTVAEVGQSTRHDRLEELPKSRRARVVKRVHECDSPNNTWPITGKDADSRSCTTLIDTRIRVDLVCGGRLSSHLERPNLL